MNKSESIKNLAIALCKAQGEIEKASKNADNLFFNSTYSNLSEVLTCVKSAFTPNGLSFTQMPSFENNIVYVETMVMHVSGEWISSVSGAPITKSNPQGVGDAITYLRRYSIAAVSGLAQEDDDGNSNSQKPQEKTKQASTNNTDDLPWYNDQNYQAGLDYMTESIANGIPPEQLIKELRQSFKMATKYSDLIKGI